MPAAPAKKDDKKKPAPAATKPTPAPKPAAAPPPPVIQPPATVEVAEVPAVEQREVIYPTVTAEICMGDNAITVDTMKMLLGWESERDYAARMMAENPGLKADDPLCKYGDLYLLTDEEGAKVRCWQNLDNREFDPKHSKGLGQTVVNFQWAGEITIPGTVKCLMDGKEVELPAGTVNGSTMVLSRTGRMESGQHSGVGLILAWQMWWKNRKKYPAWDEHVNDKGELTGPVLETIVITGVSEDPRVTMTVDNCKPRSATDVLYTSELFRNLPVQQRAEYSRMTAAAIKFLWDRTGTKGYMTNTEVMGFLDRHKRLLKCVEHLFQENQTKRGKDGKVFGSRAISALKISAGQAAALCYLMGASASDGDVYRNGFPPSEKDVDWANWDKAKQFWALIGRSEQFKPVREALARLVDSSPDDDNNQGQGGRAPEKHAIIAKAWDAFVSGSVLDGETVKLNYSDLVYDPTTKTTVKRTDGGLTLNELPADFKGIDLPDKPKAPGTDGSPDGVEVMSAEQMEAEQERVRKENYQRQQDIIKNMKLGAGGKPVVAKPVVGLTTAAK